MKNRLQFVQLYKYYVVEVNYSTNEILNVVSGPFESAEAASVAKPDIYSYRIAKLVQSVAAELIEDSV